MIRHTSSVRLWMSTLIILLLGLSSIETASAQFVRSYVVEDSITVGDRFTLVLVAEHSQPDSVVFPGIPDVSENGHPVGDALFLRKLSSGRRLLGVGNRYPIADTVAYEATTFAIDTATVASMPFQFVSAQRTTARQTDPFKFAVATVLTPDASELRGLEPLASFPRSALPYFILIAGLLGGFVLYRWMSRAKPEAAPPPPPVRRAPPPPVESPLAEANRRLSTLEKADLATDDSIKPFYVELSEILRNYVERRLHLTALESTSGELIAAMREFLPRTPIPNEVIPDMSVILETSDLAKFADVKHSVELSRATLAETRVLILRIEDSFRPARHDTSAPSERVDNEATETDLRPQPASDKTASPDTHALGMPLNATINKAPKKAPERAEITDDSTPGNETVSSSANLYELTTDSPEPVPDTSSTSVAKQETNSYAPPGLIDDAPELHESQEASPPEKPANRSSRHRQDNVGEQLDLSADSVTEHLTETLSNSDEITTILDDDLEGESSLTVGYAGGKSERSADDDDEVDEWFRNAPGASAQTAAADRGEDQS